MFCNQITYIYTECYSSISIFKSLFQYQSSNVVSQKKSFNTYHTLVMSDSIIDHIKLVQQKQNRIEFSLIQKKNPNPLNYFQVYLSYAIFFSVVFGLTSMISVHLFHLFHLSHHVYFFSYRLNAQIFATQLKFQVPLYTVL